MLQFHGTTQPCTKAPLALAYLPWEFCSDSESIQVLKSLTVMLSCVNNIASYMTCMLGICNTYRYGNISIH